MIKNASSAVHRILTAGVMLATAVGSVYAQPATKNAFLTYPAGGLNTPIGIAYSPQANRLLVTQPFCGTPSGSNATGFSVQAIDSTGAAALFANLPDVPLSTDVNSGHTTAPGNNCFENYIAVSPGLGGFPLGDVYVTQGTHITHIPALGGSSSSFGGTLTGARDTENGITFDNVGSFCNDIIVVSGNGLVFLVDSTGLVTPYAAVSTIQTPTLVGLESSTVAPMSFTGYPGWLFVAVENSNVGPVVVAIQPPNSCPTPGTAVTVPPTGTTNSNCGGTPVVCNVGNQPGGPEGILTVPAQAAACNFGTPTVGGSLFSVTYSGPVSLNTVNTNAYQIVAYPASNFTSLVGDIALSTEGDNPHGSQPTNILSPGAGYGSSVTTTLFDSGSGSAPTFTQQEGLAFAQCPAPIAGGCPATQGFWHKISNWPQVTKTVDGVQFSYLGGGNFTITVGSNTYTQAQVDSLLPSGSLHSGALNNSLSQFFAAIINLAAGAQHTTAGDNAINSDVTALGSQPIFCGSALCTLTPSSVTTIENNLNALDAYNSAVGLGCTEASGLFIGSGKN